MQLKKIKLAGFKSFVDPTTLLLPSNLVAVVGPNGCGKSNIIDAVCWVMGESSARYLRGESLTDVIFNGSSARKPVGLASVELIFDNQDGSLGGEYASYSEISIRRQLSRDTESAYFLNGTRCRRRDIIDIFLGTGLGPRSYAIIGQNMISRIIEAKPDEMRVYLEEAAGISRYKERRRETESRIQHTKENLARLNDVRAELDKQLSSLKRQANAAEKFKHFKQEERVLRAQYLAIQWRDLDARLVNRTLQVQQQATGLEARQAELSELHLELDFQRDTQRVVNETLQEVQRHYYTVGNEITRYEQDIHHHQERQKQCQTDIQHLHVAECEIKQQQEEAGLQFNVLTETIRELEPLASKAMDAVHTGMAKLSHAEEVMQDWQIEWDELNQVVSKNAQIVQVEQTRVQHLEQKIASLQQRQLVMEQEKKQFDFVAIEKEITDIAHRTEMMVQETERCREQVTEANQKIAELQSSVQNGTNQLNQMQKTLQVLHGKQASLEALQETALGRGNHQMTQWLAQHQLEKNPRLAEAVDVAAGWEQAVEMVLGGYLQAICVDDIAKALDLAPHFKQGSLNVIAKNTKASSKDVEKNTLLSKIQSSLPLETLLSGVYIASSHDEAFALYPTLNSKESVITQDGLWLGGAWFRLSKNDNPEAGLFQREQELKQITKQINELTDAHQEADDKLIHSREQLKEWEKQRNNRQQEVNQLNMQSAEIHAQKRITEQKMIDLKKRADRSEKEAHDSKIQLESAEIDLKKSRLVSQEASSAFEKQTEQRETLTHRRDELRHALQQIREEVNQSKDEAHQIDISLQAKKLQQISLQQTSTRLDAEMATLINRKAALQNELQSGLSIHPIQEKLTNALTLRLNIESDLNQARLSTETVNQTLRTLEARRQEIEPEVASFRQMLENLRIDCEGLKVKAETFLEQINETGFHVENVLKELPENAAANEWQASLDQVTQRIARLGPINLVAIEEYATCAERKEYLDKQNADLQEGLTTLENAITKIDKETRTRFKETFDKVNNRFQELFPRVFGGGRAYLELTGDNLLDVGITVMACPPGKRNSTIHLLSGGEKALTAIALVFSIFHLNPAPFCMLDEVDAPLDDANIGRFCHLVKSMAEKTQFIFISHNKLAIEMGENLVGVTMHEPGVSRLVSVDMQEAMSLAGI